MCFLTTFDRIPGDVGDLGFHIHGSHLTPFRIDKGEHHLTLNKLETLLNKLKIRLSGVFPEEF